MQKIVGNGTYGIVYKAQDTVNNKIVAIKRVQRSSTEQGICISVMRQIGFLRNIKHPNIVKLEGFSFRQNQDFVYLIFQHIQTDLSKLIQKQKISLQKIKILIKQILKGILHCHKLRYIHRDIKPGNILVDSQMQIVKLADFGLVRQINYPPRCMSLSISSLYYKSPQLLIRNSFYGSSIDMWGIGCVLAECILGKPLFCCYNTTQVNQLNKIFSKFSITTPFQITEDNLNNIEQIINTSQQRPIQQKVPQLYKLGKSGLDLLNKLLSLKTQSRISAQKALQHHYFSEIQQQ